MVVCQDQRMRIGSKQKRCFLKRSIRVKPTGGRGVKVLDLGVQFGIDIAIDIVSSRDHVSIENVGRIGFAFPNHQWNHKAEHSYETD